MVWLSWPGAERPEGGATALEAGLGCAEWGDGDDGGQDLREGIFRGHCQAPVFKPCRSYPDIVSRTDRSPRLDGFRDQGEGPAEAGGDEVQSRLPGQVEGLFRPGDWDRFLCREHEAGGPMAFSGHAVQVRQTSGSNGVADDAADL